MCLSPIEAWQSKRVNPETGKRDPVFSRKDAFVDLPKFRLPCSKCINCVAKVRRKRGVKVYHESIMHEYSCFITPTYDDEHCPGEVVGSDFQKFMKRWRYYNPEVFVKYLAVGELGEQTQRPHFHAIICGTDFVRGAEFSPDYSNWRNDQLEEIWGKGHIRIDPVTPASAIYVAGYTHKKLVNDTSGAKCSFWRGQSHNLGRSFVNKYVHDLAVHGMAVLPSNSKRKPSMAPIPDCYFDWEPERLAALKAERLEKALELRREPEAIRLVKAQNKALNLKALMALKSGKKL